MIVWRKDWGKNRAWENCAAILKMKGNRKKRGKWDTQEKEICGMIVYCFPVNGIAFQPNKTLFKKTEKTLCEKNECIENLSFDNTDFFLYFLLWKEERLIYFALCCSWPLLTYLQRPRQSQIIHGHHILSFSRQRPFTTVNSDL